MTAREPAYRVDGELAVPAAFYRLACDPRRSVVVEACAGAGKTWMLVSRILRALLAGGEPHEILAITFTRKAAGEMRQRLQDWLLAFARSDAAGREHALVERGCTPAEARALEPALGALYGRLLEGHRAVEIRTFHGWFSQLLRSAPLALLEPLGLRSDVELLEDRVDLQPRYWRRFLRAVAADDSLRTDYNALVRERGRHTVAQWLEEALEHRIEIARADAAGVLESSVPPAAGVWPEFAAWPTPAGAVREPGLRGLLTTLAREFGASGKAKPIEAAEAIERALALADDAIAFDTLWLAVFTKTDTRRRLGDNPVQDQVCDALEWIAEARAQQAAHDTHARLVRLSRVLLASYAEAKRERGLADMADLELCAEHLLADAELAGWVQERLDARVRHLLIDEFQDTSPLQWRTLAAWLGGYAGAGGGASGQQPLSVFIVGDPKQSIYRFRRADPRVFVEAREFVVQALGGVHLACDHTRRNAPAVLDVLNAVFERAQSDGEFAGFRAHTTDVRTPYGAVRVAPAVPRPQKADRNLPGGWRDSLNTPRIESEEARRLAEARQVAAEVARLVREQGFRPGEIQVLCRKRAPLAFVAQALREQGVAHAAPEQRELMAAPEARDLVALLDVLASPSHDLSLAHALKSPVFGASDDDLVALATSSRAAGTDWFTALQQQADGRSAALARARTLLAAWAVAAAQLPPHDLLDRIVSEGDVHARYAAVVPRAGRAQALSAIDALLAQALLLDGARYATPYNFVRSLKRRRVLLAPQAGSDAVQLLTVHGAKGLEARAVFVVDSQPEAPRAGVATLLIDWPADAVHPTRCAFVASESRCPPSLQASMAAELAGRAREELNALYVAMTRARELLVFTATEPHRAAVGPSAWQRVADALEPETPLNALEASSPWPEAPETVDAVIADAPRRATDTVTLRMLPVLAPSAHAPRGMAEAADTEASRMGRAVHRVLEWLPAPNQLTRAAEAAAAEFALPGTASPRIEAIVRAVLDSPECAGFFDATVLHWSGNEVAIGWQGQTLRIDRLVARAGSAGREWWVLDYKLQHAPHAVDAYRAQLAVYRDAVQALQPGEPVRAAFITGDGRVLELTDAV